MKILPPGGLCCFITLMAALLPYMAPSRLVDTMSLTMAASAVSKLALTGCEMPALLTQTSHRPICLIEKSASACTSSGFCTSQGKLDTDLPGCFACNAATASAHASAEREVMTTSSPKDRKVSAKAYPSPLELPVTTTFKPSSFRLGLGAETAEASPFAAKKRRGE
eukprot:CAMPEP_0117649322 /NCGR_PEP_ID=MMETSP0804-20121206/907_1 /TAXON_ID=1074897 /ORGANISM="Tetraselmis astigmatica, Strain CCMP880" /LENGTH=165 /DNA_ID=CAMNT_0005455045 /DNA_START=575 /DNA_END=1069 /DNA_ORIENTATION=+